MDGITKLRDCSKWAYV
jgi:hypothetical protein